MKRTFNTELIYDVEAHLNGTLSTMAEQVNFIDDLAHNNSRMIEGHAANDAIHASRAAHDDNDEHAALCALASLFTISVFVLGFVIHTVSKKLTNYIDQQAVSTTMMQSRNVGLSDVTQDSGKFMYYRSKVLRCDVNCSQ